MSYSVTDRLLIGTLLSATFGTLLFVVSVFMPHEGNGYIPATSIAIACGVAFVVCFVAYLVTRNSKR